MITSMVIYTAYKHYKKWKSGGVVEEDDATSSRDDKDNTKSSSGFSDLLARIDVMKNAKTIGICILYMFLGPSLILLNKYILSDLGFPYPMFLSGLGVAVSAIVARVVVALGYVQLSKKEAVEGSLWYRRVLPVGLAHAATLAFGNTVYLLLNVGFIQMLKSFTPNLLLYYSPQLWPDWKTLIYLQC